jgi:ADP-heptose:LPS heptosyltransferase
MQRIFKSGLFSWLTKAPLRIGFHKNNAKEGNYLFNNCFIAKQDPNENKLRHYLMFLPEIGLVVPEKPDFGLLRTVPNLKLPEGFVAKKFVVVVLGSSWESKDWPLAGYLELCRIWQERRQEPLVLVGTVSDQVAARKITEQIPSIINLCGSTSLEELLAVLFHAKAAIGPDSGPGHLAAAIGIPYISLFGPTPPERVGPFSMDDLVVRAHVGCMPCYQRKCPGLDKVCMRLISAEAVYAKLVYGINKKEVVHGR